MNQIDFHKRNSMIWDGNLSSSETLLLIAFTLYTDAEGKCFPGVNTLAKMTKLKRRSIQRLLDGLVSKGVVKKDSRYNENGSQSSNLYSIDYFGILPLPPVTSSHPPVTSSHPPRDIKSPELIQLTNPVNKLNSPERTSTSKKSANAESLISKTPEAEPTSTSPLEAPLNTLDEETYQLPREDGKKYILEGNQTVEHPSLDNNPNPSQGIDSAPPRTTKLDKTKTIFGKPIPKTNQEDRAKSDCFIDRGTQNKRWRDMPDFQKFRDYAIDWARIRRERPELGTPGQVYDDRWVRKVLNQTANCTIDDSPILTCWKAWVTSVPPSPTIEPKPDLPIIQTSPEILAKIEAFRLQAAKDKAQREAAANAKQARLTIWEAECA